MIPEAKKKVLKYLVETLNKHEIPFQVSGGLAAIMYGSRRELDDIDIEINKRNCHLARELFEKFITTDFHLYTDSEFQLWMMTLNVDGVSVDINQVEDSYIFNTSGNKFLLPDELIDTEMKQIDDIIFPVQNRMNLLDYKKRLDREPHSIDVAEMLLAANRDVPD